MGAITVVTAQNSREVRQVHFIPPEMVVAQIETVLADYGAAAIKTGFIGQAETIQAIAECLIRWPGIPLVIDPVLVNHKGGAMFPPQVTEAYQHYLFPLATLITPNRHEAALLTGLPVTTREEMFAAAQQLLSFGPRHIYLKGVREGKSSVDGWFEETNSVWLTGQWIETNNTHGSGDTLSAAATFFLGQGIEMGVALAQAHQFTQKAIAAAAPWQLTPAHGPINPLFLIASRG